MPINKNDTYDAVYGSPIGQLGVIMDSQSLTSLDWLSASVSVMAPKSRLAGEICDCLDAYFTSARDVPDCRLSLHGTDFQQRAWHALMAIPAGQVMTYGELAKQLNTSSRAIGQACRTNPIAILIPCHRIVAANGVGGYMGASRQLHIKQWLLEHEGAQWLRTIRH